MYFYDVLLSINKLVVCPIEVYIFYHNEIKNYENSLSFNLMWNDISS